MADLLERLKRLDVEAIAQRTKISPANIQKLLQRDFEAFGKVQFFGFISILEREYGLDLHLLKEEYIAYQAQMRPVVEEREYVIGTPRERSSRRWWLALLVLALLGWAAYLLLPQPLDNFETVVEYPAISKAKERLEAVHQQARSESNGSHSSAAALLLAPNTTAEAISSASPDMMNAASSNTEFVEPDEALEANETLETHETSEADKTVEQSVSASSAQHPTELVFIPTRRLWLGLIDAQTNQKVQAVIETPYEINTSKRWRGILGHGYVEVRVNGVAKTYRTPDKLWFVYDNGTFETIDSAAFLQLNGGKSW